MDLFLSSCGKVDFQINRRRTKSRNPAIVIAVFFVVILSLKKDGKGIWKKG
jgi:hypothetical protein